MPNKASSPSTSWFAGWRYLDVIEMATACFPEGLQSQAQSVSCQGGIPTREQFSGTAFSFRTVANLVDRIPTLGINGTVQEEVLSPFAQITSKEAKLLWGHQMLE
ncbi:MAG: hypothetical protein ACE5HL_06135 [Terriglobia bacterium]